MTGLPLVETKGNDVSAYIPTNVISITDGQIFLETGLFNSGVRPAINVGISVSRVGGSAQIKAMKSVAGRLRLDLAQFRELEAFASFSSDLDASSRATLDRGQRLVELLKQGQYSPFPVEREVVSLWLGTTGKLDVVPVSDVRRFESEFLDFIARGDNGIFDEIRTSKALGDDAVQSLEKAVEAFYGQFTTVRGRVAQGQRARGRGHGRLGAGSGARPGQEEGLTHGRVPPRAAAPHPLHAVDEEDLLGAGADRRCPHRARPGPGGGVQALRPGDHPRAVGAGVLGVAGPPAAHRAAEPEAGRRSS